MITASFEVEHDTMLNRDGKWYSLGGAETFMKDQKDSAEGNLERRRAMLEDRYGRKVRVCRH